MFISSSVSTQNPLSLCRCSAALGKASMQDVGMTFKPCAFPRGDQLIRQPQISTAQEGTGMYNLSTSESFQYRSGINLELDWISFSQRVYFSGSYGMNHVQLVSGLAFRKNWKNLAVIHSFVTSSPYMSPLSLLLASVLSLFARLAAIGMYPAP